MQYFPMGCPLIYLSDDTLFCYPFAAAVGEEKRLHQLTEDIDEKLRNRELKDMQISVLMEANSSLKQGIISFSA